jgi:MFS family permease
MAVTRPEADPQPGAGNAAGRSAPGVARTTAASAGALVVVSIPTFLLGAFGPAIKDDFDIGDTEYGLLFTFGFLVSATVLQFAGAFADRRGAQLAIRIAMVVGILGAVAFGFVPGFALMFGAFALSRIAEATAQPATNTLVGAVVAPHQQGRSVGFKQAAIPTATGLAGLAVPLFGSGTWRPAFVLVAVPAALVFLAVPHAPVQSRGMAAPRRQLLQSRYLQLIGLGGAFAAAAMVSVGSFLVSGAENVGFSENNAGLLLTLGALFMIPARIGWGFLADARTFNRFAAVGLCLAAAAVALGLFAVGQKWSFIAGTVLMFALGWSWPGLLLFAVIEQHPNEPGSATAIVQTAVRLGAVSSPFIFGWLADNRGYRTAWLTAAGSATVSAVLLAAGAVVLARQLRGALVRP